MGHQVFRALRGFAKGSELARRLFARSLGAQRPQLPGLLLAYRFIDAQDWEISNLKIGVKMNGADRAVATVTFRIFKEMRTMTLDLVRTPAGWRIADIRGPSGSLRELYKLQ